MYTVRELINQLQKYPQESIIGVQLHDNKKNELQGFVDSIFPFYPFTSFDPEYCKNCNVVIRVR